MIKAFTKTQELTDYLSQNNSKDIGFVPTMGNLHAGHLSLLKKSISENPISIISIFVNPTQFSKGEDFSIYPRTFKSDLEKIHPLDTKHVEIIIFAPSCVEEIYPDGKKTLEACGPSNQLEGQLRAGHFDGVVTVVKRLFEITSPSKAYFGKKDYQQLCIVKNLVKKYHFNIDIVSMPIIRESSGLAMSSRNSFLNEEEKKEALTLHHILIEIRDSIKKPLPLTDIQLRIKSILNDKRFNYLEICQQADLSPVTSLNGKIVILGNFQINNIKLLDNIETEVSNEL